MTPSQLARDRQTLMLSAVPPHRSRTHGKHRFCCSLQSTSWASPGGSCLRLKIQELQLEAELLQRQEPPRGPLRRTCPQGLRVVDPTAREGSGLAWADLFL